MKQAITKIFVAVVFLLSVVSLAHAQRTITGTVTDSKTGETLIGANVLIAGTSNGTVTDLDGAYSIALSEGAAELIFSFTGYSSQTVAIGASNVIDVAMDPGTILDEVVIIGYGTTKVEDATGAVTTLKTKDFNQGILNSPEQLIQGRTAGVQITSASGEPGAGADIRIRGASSVRAGNRPLIVVDGVPLDGGDVSPGADIGFGSSSSRNPLNFINPADIESIDILKDASSAAIYGTRGANGVIFITTKKGKAGAPQISYNGSVGIGNIARTYDLLNADEYPNAARSAGNSNPDEGGSVDALGDILRTAITQNHNVSVGGGSETGNYRFSLGILDQEGIIKNSGQRKYNGTAKMVQYAFDNKLKLEGTIIASYIEDEMAPISDNVGAEGDLMSSALRWNPTRRYTNADGSFNQPSDNQRNPQAFLAYFSDNTETQRILANAAVSYTLAPGLDYRFNLGVDRSSALRGVGVSSLFNANFSTGRGVASIESINAKNNILEHTLTYVKDITSKINLNALAGYSYQNFERRGSKQVGRDFNTIDQNLYVRNLQFASSFPVVDQRAFYDPNVELQSVFGRAQISIADKFLVTGTLRADGSSKFQGDNKYGYFPSFAAAWKLSDEAFIPEFFDLLKLRVGYGITGNQEFGAGLTRDQVFPEFTGANPSQRIVGNPNLKWESTVQTSVGLDFEFANSRFGGSIDYFSKNTNDLLFRLPTIAPAPPGFFWTNLSDLEVKNSGVELGFYGTLVEKQDLTVDFNVNASFFTNSIENVSSGFPSGIATGAISGQGLSGETGQLLWDGQELYAFYVPDFLGFDDSGAPIYRDINGDGNIDIVTGTPGTVDRTFAGSPNPDMLLGVQGNIQYKNLDFSFFMNGAFGHQVMDNTALALFSKGALRGGNNVTRNVVDTNEDPGNSLSVSSRYLYNADFLRMANATLGYNLNMASTNWIKNLRVFVTGQNLFLISDYPGFDPEVNINKSVDGVPSFGIDYTAYPRARTIIFGINANF
jgi:iron complex outermembrane receptor protein